jgi:hypothetical protein
MVIISVEDFINPNLVTLKGAGLIENGIEIG